MKRICIVFLCAACLLGGCGNQPGTTMPGVGREGVDITIQTPANGQETSGQYSAGTDSGNSSAAGADAAHSTAQEASAPDPRARLYKTDAAFDGSTVMITKSDQALATDITAEEIDSMVRKITPDLDSVIHNGQTVVLKPNLVQMKVDSTGDLLDKEVNGVTTDWRVTDAVVRRVRELNPDGKVYIMEGSASGPTSKVMEYFHYTPEYIKGVDAFIRLEEDCGAWKDYDAPEVVKVDLPEGLLHQTYYFNRILYEADVLISIPCLKTSSGVVVTAGIKNVSLGTPPGNLYGIGPNNPSKQKMVSHKITDGELDKWIYDYYCAKPIDYVIVDGLQGFQSGPVPMSQERKETDKMNMGVMLAGSDAVAVDTICSLVVGWDPESVGYLKLFKENKDKGHVEQILVKGGYVDDLRKYFTIKRPELGGIQITDDKGPDLTVSEVKVQGNMLLAEYETDGDAFKLEAYIDGFFRYSAGPELLPPLSLDISGMEKGSHTLQVISYDRFLNKTIKTAEFQVP